MVLVLRNLHSDNQNAGCFSMGFSQPKMMNEMGSIGYHRDIIGIGILRLSFDQGSKPLLVVDYRGFYYPVYRWFVRWDSSWDHGMMDDGWSAGLSYPWDKQENVMGGPSENFTLEDLWWMMDDGILSWNHSPRLQGSCEDPMQCTAWGLCDQAYFKMVNTWFIYG